MIILVLLSQSSTLGGKYLNILKHMLVTTSSFSVYDGLPLNRREEAGLRMALTRMKES